MRYSEGIRAIGGCFLGSSPVVCQLRAAGPEPLNSESLIEFALEPHFGKIPIALRGISRNAENLRRIIDRKAHEKAQGHKLLLALILLAEFLQRFVEGDQFIRAGRCRR